MLRRFFTGRWLSEHVAIDVRPRHDPISISNDELPEVQVWLVVRNDGYFEVELDRLAVELVLGAAIVRGVHLRRSALSPGSTEEVFVRIALTAAQTSHIKLQRKQQQSMYATVQVTAEFNSKIHNFPKDTGQLSGIRPELRLRNDA